MWQHSTTTGLHKTTGLQVFSLGGDATEWIDLRLKSVPVCTNPFLLRAFAHRNRPRWFMCTVSVDTRETFWALVFDSRDSCGGHQQQGRAVRSVKARLPPGFGAGRSRQDWTT